MLVSQLASAPGSPMVRTDVSLAEAAGSRPSASFCRWASITIAAAGRSSAGTSSQASASSASAGALAALEGGEQAALAHLAVLDVLGQLRGRVGDPGPVAGADQLDRLGLQQAQRVHVGGQRAAVGRDEGRALRRARGRR